MLGPRTGLSFVLIVGSIVLLIAIVAGNSMGGRVLGQIASRQSEIAPSPVATATQDTSADVAARGSWKHGQIISVATDPGFPDPRVTPEPPPPATPRPAPKSTPTPRPTVTATAASSGYTSPPLPLPIVSHDPNEQSDPYGEPLPSATPTDDPAHPTPSERGIAPHNEPTM